MRAIGLKRRYRGFTMIELLVVMAVVAILIGVLLPAIHHCREAAQRARCLNNLQQLSIALHSYHMTFKVLPPGCVDSDGPVVNQDTGYHVSWIAQILPMLEETPMFQRIDFIGGAYAYTNNQVRALRPQVLQCTAAVTAGTPEISSYAACAGGEDVPLDVDNTGLLFLNSSIQFQQIEDGTSNTVILGERVPGDTPNQQELGWLSGTSSTLRHTGAAPLQWPVTTTSSLSPDFQLGTFNSPHLNHAVPVAMADGSVRSVSPAIGIDVWSHLGNRMDGNMIGSIP